MDKNKLTFESKSLSAKLAAILMVAFILTSLQRFSVHPSGGHTHRQADTLGMAMVFAEDLKQRGFQAFDFIFLPKILQKGLLDGINASEFPLMNILCGPFFLLGSWIGVFCSSLFVLLVNLGVAYLFVPRIVRFWGVRLDGLISLVIWFSIPVIASQSNIFMPEGFAFPLMVVGICFILEGLENYKKYICGILLCNLAIAVKPTVVISFILLAAFWLMEQNRKYIYRLILAIGLGVLFPFYWYEFHSKWILSFAQGPQIFALAGFNPFEKLQEVGLSEIVKLIFREIYQGQFPMFLGIIWIFCAMWAREWTMLLCYIVSLVAAISLDGPHIKIHGYYFIGTGIVTILLIAKVLSKFESKVWISRLLVLSLFWGLMYDLRGNIWIWARDSQYWKVNFWEMGSIARSKIPETYRLITDDSQYPQKMLFIGRSGYMASGDVFMPCTDSHYRNEPLAIVVDGDNSDYLYSCQNRDVTVEVLKTSFATWSLIKAVPKKG